jgi:hypothetical protein
VAVLCSAATYLIVMGMATLPADGRQRSHHVAETVGATVALTMTLGIPASVLLALYLGVVALITDDQPDRARDRRRPRGPQAPPFILDEPPLPPAPPRPRRRG